MCDQSKPAQPATIACNHGWRDRLPFENRTDFENARRGFIATFDGDEVRREDGRVVWDFRAYDFQESEEAPDTVNPSLWRLARLNNHTGLFQVCERIYQVRGFDLSNMNIIEGDSGLIIMDPLVSAEVAKAGLELYYQHRPHRPVVAVIYTHSHVDHFGGVKGVISEEEVHSGKVRVYAPEGFMEETVSENVYAGPAMRRRAQYMYGGLLPKGPRGQVDAGLGKGTSRGTVTLIAPTDEISEAFETHTIDGVEIEFQLTPGTEAPAEMNLYFPQWRALCVAENACQCMHNILTIRGALVRDPRIWSYYLGQTLARYGDRSDVLFAQHHWPTWGADNIREYLADQRDMYAFLNDETLRLLNHGLTPMDIAEHIKSLPQPLAQRWHARDYYGSVSHNVRAVYQRYMGFYDANPAHLNPLPPVASARRTIEWMGGAEAVLEKARAEFERGEYRWVAEIVNQVVFADPDNAAARELQADTLEQLGYQCENTTWRNAYLTGAQELRKGVKRVPGGQAPDLVRALTPAFFFSLLAIRLDSEKAASQPMTLNWHFPDLDQDFALTVRNGVLTYLEGHRHDNADASVTMGKADLDQVGLGKLTLPQCMQDGRLAVAGDQAKVAALFSMLDQFQSSFNIVTPATLG
ncbi:beta-lactamase-like protein [Alloalcanivorax dieselolei B5]|uniref:Linear primary-alkylsulfatase n=1 Tax=Alcanivorax dieselolei (strain DSM 16502 / CGMCC 1.3690 / MCCC 1A00001 / B-5) TaxID=930169 RepID=K0CLE9_ALCDB|nr:alkyl sulfatase dimerization domain-containing protein [Alloalcanivorax dieselolei]AFT72446.1 beta-lactamase-like protein [Alloalcanivorax dieselolei B5]GGJ77896.1 alkyl sulfatase [Alloalcanivorax dieselolei]